MQLNDKNGDFEIDSEINEPSEIEDILNQTAQSINTFKRKIEDERDQAAIELERKAIGNDHGQK